MVKAVIDIPNEANQVLNIVKARYGLKTKSEAIAKVVGDYGAEMLEPGLKPEYVEKFKRIEKEGKFMSFDSLEDLKRNLENA